MSLLVAERPILDGSQWFYTGEDSKFIQYVATLDDDALTKSKTKILTHLNATEEVLEDIRSIYEEAEYLRSDIIK